jgi:hypothetical protein
MSLKNRVAKPEWDTLSIFSRHFQGGAATNCFAGLHKACQALVKVWDELRGMEANAPLKLLLGNEETPDNDALRVSPSPLDVWDLLEEFSFDFSMSARTAIALENLLPLNQRLLTRSPPNIEYLV